MEQGPSILVERLTPEAMEPFGWVIAIKTSADDPLLFGNATTKWRTGHDFDPGEGGVTELVWVNYGRKPLLLDRMESHRLTEQAFLPLGGSVPLVHVLAPPPSDPMAMGIVPDMKRAKAFLIDGSMGVCLRRGTWHAHFALGDWANFLMITRRSTTIEIEKSMGGDSGSDQLVETERAAVRDAEGRGYRLHLS